MRPGWSPDGRLDNLWAQDAEPEVKEKAISDALDFWELEFPRREDSDPETRLPVSRYHAQHPNRAQVASIGRLWLFPDSHRYMTSIIDGEVQSPYARQGWPAELYSPYVPDHLLGTIYMDPFIGGGLADAEN
jgi:hypothetical protein